MGKVRYSVLENDKAIAAATDSGTETIDLPETGILSELDVMARTTISYTNDVPTPIFVTINKLEVLVDGSTVVKSLDGRETKALIYYNKGPFATAGWYHSSESHNVYYHHFPLYFGRHANDPLYGLNLDAYSNPQLKITWDASQTSDHGVTYDANSSPAFTYNIQAKVYDSTPPGFTNRYVQSREINTFTVAASTETNVEIPRGYDLRGIMVEGAYYNVDWFALTEHLKLDFDNGKWVPIDMDYENLKACQLAWFPEPVAIEQRVYAANADTMDFQVMELNSITTAPTSLDYAAISTGNTTYGMSDINVFTEAGVNQTTGSTTWQRIAGWGPMGTFYFPMNQLLDGTLEAIDTKQFGRIDLKHKTGSGSGTSATIKTVAEYIKPNGE